MKTTFLATKVNSPEVDAILLFIRIIMGIMFAMVGWPKIQQPMSWMGPDSGFPGFFLMLAAISEFIGGLALVLGVLTRIAAFGLACTMAVATYVMAVNYGASFVDMQGGKAYNLNLLLLGVALLFMLNGPGRLSLDRLFFGVTPKRPVI
jgi:putative oxidoreductase